MNKSFSSIVSCLVLFPLLALADPKPPSKTPKPDSEKHEAWKGNAPTTEVTLGGLGGMAIVGSSIGGILLGTVAKKLVNRGFVPDINNQVFLEAQAGPVFVNSMTLIAMNLHLRWDFHKDDDVTLYALGGFGSLLSTDTVRKSHEFFPRVGVGALWNLVAVSIRTEVSHEFVAAGVQFGF